MAVFLNLPTPPNIWMTELALTDSLMMPASSSSGPASVSSVPAAAGLEIRIWSFLMMVGSIQ